MVLIEKQFLMVLQEVKNLQDFAINAASEDS